MNTERFDSRLLWGALLILAGFLFLLQNLGFFNLFGLFSETLWSLLWVGLFAVGGIAFLLGFFAAKENWWMAIPGSTLSGLAVTAGSDLLLGDPLSSGSFFLLSVAAGFWLVYARQRAFWWALIPAGVMTTLSVVAGLDEIVRFDTGAIFFFGLSATFVLVALVPTPEGRMTWAWIPAGVLFVLAIVVAASFEALFNFVWPLVLIGIGLLVLYRSLVRRPG